MTAVYVDIIPTDFSTEIMQLILQQAPDLIENRIPTPVDTTASPSTQNRRIFKNVQRCVSDVLTCGICLERMHKKAKFCKSATQLPCCKQHLHVTCLFSLVPPPTLGAAAVVSCPFCRHSMHLEILEQMGINVRPTALIFAAKIANAIQQLQQKSSKCVRQFSETLSVASKYTVVDGFIYNCAMINIDRA